MNLVTKIKIVVIEENTLGYIYPDTPNSFNVISTIITKHPSSRFHNYNHFYGPFTLPEQNVRLAKENDFDIFRVNFEQYQNAQNEFEFEIN